MLLAMAQPSMAGMIQEAGINKLAVVDAFMEVALEWPPPEQA
jgi:hypothetical protein